MTESRLANALNWSKAQTFDRTTPKERLIYNREYAKRRRKTDANFKILCLLRSRFTAALRCKGLAKRGKTVSMLGCTVPELRVHLERQFKAGMSWANHGPVWEIDHIKPCCAFDLRHEEQQRECFHFTNLAPLWRNKNRSKGGGIYGKQRRNPKA